MKAILEFTLPEEESEHKSALDGGAWISVVFDFDQWLRVSGKYGDKEVLRIEEVRSKLHEIISEAGLSLG